MCWPKEVVGLSFKDLHTLNLAMLAKQGCRIMKHDDALVSRILKAKYFANGDFMNAQLGSNPSYTWRSILERKKSSRERVIAKSGKWIQN